MSYDGETRARNLNVALFLTCICPGLGYMYIGRLLRALTVNLLFVLLVELFIISQSWLKFFPLLPGAVLLLGWVLLTVLVALDVRDLLTQEECAGEYVLKTYNHWVFYALAALCTMYLPVALSIRMFLTGLWLVVPIGHDGMAPTLWRGDVVLVDRQGWRGEKLAMEAGELVAVGPARSDGPVFVLRVVAVEGEQVRVEHEHLYLRDELTQQRAPQEGELAGLALPDHMVPMVEELGGKIYPVLLTRRGGVVSSVPQTKIEEGTIFLLTDNRGQVALSEGGERMWDSRDVGAVPLNRVKGRPRYVLWSSDPETGAVRWDRIGLRLDVQDRAPAASEATAPKR
jgi:signal peptidase I